EGRDPALRGGPGGVLVGIPLVPPPRVEVLVDEPWQDSQAPDVQLLVGVQRLIGDRRDPSLADADIYLLDEASGKDDLSVQKGEIVQRHVASPFATLRVERRAPTMSIVTGRSRLGDAFSPAR